MTQHRSFKTLVRARMAKTGESYTAARARLLGTPLPGSPPGSPRDDEAPAGTGAAAALPSSDATVRERTGRGWEEWFDLLDEAGMHGRPHREISRYVADLQGVVPLAWKAQVVTAGYERARGGRLVGQHEDGFRVSVSRTVGAGAEQVFDAFADEQHRARWLTGVVLVPRTSTRPARAHFDTGDGRSRVHVTVDAKEDGRSTVSVQHARLADAAAADLARSAWRDRLKTLKDLLEAGAQDDAAHDDAAQDDAALGGGGPRG